VRRERNEIKQIEDVRVATEQRSTRRSRSRLDRDAS